MGSLYPNLQVNEPHFTPHRDWFSFVVEVVAAAVLTAIAPELMAMVWEELSTMIPALASLAAALPEVVTTFIGGAVQGMFVSALEQGVMIGMGDQTRFSWRAVKSTNFPQDPSILQWPNLNSLVLPRLMLNEFL